MDTIRTLKILGKWSVNRMMGNRRPLIAVFSLLEHDVDELWSRPEWEAMKTCKDCAVLGCVWYSSQSPSTVARGYMRGISTLIKRQLAPRQYRLLIN